MARCLHYHRPNPFFFLFRVPFFLPPFILGIQCRSKLFIKILKGVLPGFPRSGQIGNKIFPKISHERYGRFWKRHFPSGCYSIRIFSIRPSYWRHFSVPPSFFQKFSKSESGERITCPQNLSNQIVHLPAIADKCAIGKLVGYPISHS